MTQTVFADQPAASAQSSSQPAQPAPRPALEHIKSPSAFRTISEVAAELEVPQHVLRFWESKFPQIRPLKRGGGRRYYRPEDISLLKQIQGLLYGQGYTIRGVQKVLREHHRVGGPSAIQRISQPQPQSQAQQQQAINALTDAQADMSAEAAVLSAYEVLAPARNTLPVELRKELETILGELKALRALLKQSGI